MRELKNTELETIAGGHRGDFDHALGEGKAAYAKTGSIGFAAVVFLAHYDFS